MAVSFVKTDLPEVILCQGDVFPDDRGFFAEIYHADKYTDADIRESFVQDNVSHSIQFTLRGLHYQLRRAQAKLISVISGSILDVAVDIRRDSPTFGQHVAVELSAENRRQLFVPRGFAHGFCVLSEWADVFYKCSDVYTPGDDYGLAWDDPALNIKWPTPRPLLSEKDSHNLSLQELAAQDVLPRKEDAEK